MYEQQLQQLKNTGMYYSGVHKKYFDFHRWDQMDNSAGALVDTFGYYENERGRWIVFVMDSERGISIFRIPTESEQEAVEELIRLAENRNFCHLCDTTLKNFPQKEPLLMNYLRTEHNYSVDKAQETIAFLRKAKYFAFEFAYYVENGKLVPDKFANDYRGHTVKSLVEEEKMPVLEAFLHIVTLKLNAQK